MLFTQETVSKTFMVPSSTSNVSAATILSTTTITTHSTLRLPLSPRMMNDLPRRPIRCDLSLLQVHLSWSLQVEPLCTLRTQDWLSSSLLYKDILETANTDSHISQVTARAAYLDPNKDTRTVPASELPKCPECKTGLLRPGVVVSSILISLRQSRH